MPATKTSAFQVGGKTRFFGVSLGGGSTYPDAARYWGGHTAGWPSGDLDSFNQHALLQGRNPDAVRLYSTNPSATTGVTGSAGAYGLITSDWRAIANTGCILVITHKYDTVPSTWGPNADALNAVGTNATKTAYTNIAQNLKRWHDDTGNTAPIKKIIFGFWHEPSNDGGVPADYVRYVQAQFNFLRTVGVSDGPKPATGPGSAYVGTWYDMLEWCFVDINANFANGTPASTYAGNYYPGDGYMRWVLADGYNWAGGQAPGGGQAATDALSGKVPQPGRTITAGHYADTWKTAQFVFTNNFYQWYAAGPGGFRNVLLGLGEVATSEDIDRFPIVSGSLSGAANHTGIPNLKGDWIDGMRHWLRGETWTAPNAVNNIVAANLAFGSQIIMPIWWNSQAAAPRWWNTLSFAPGDTTAPTQAGHYTFDHYVTLANDDIFSSGATTHTAPTLTAFTTRPTPGGTSLDWTFDATAVAGDSAIVSYTYDFGDGSSAVVDTSALLTDETAYSYAAAGVYNATVTVVDANALTDVKTVQVVVTVVTPAVTAYAGANLMQTGDLLSRIRFTYNPAIVALETYTALGNGTRVVAASGASQTLLDSRLFRYQDITLTANCTIALPASPVPGMILRVVCRQDATASRTVTWTHANAIKWPGGTPVVMTATPAATSDGYEFECVTAGSWRARRYSVDMR